MRVVDNLTELRRQNPTLLTIGAFDGVHRGHQFLIRQVVERARWLGYDSLVIAFDPRPEVVLRPGNRQLTDGRAKARIISALGPDTLALLPFTPELAQVPAPQFLLTLLEHVNLKEIWVGGDFAFGHKRQGNVQFLIDSGMSSGFAVMVEPRQQLDGVAISSSLIRELVGAGQVEQASTYLGHYFGFAGPVVRGFGRGRELLGFPTANLQPPPFQDLPATGIYAGYAHLAGVTLPAAISAGYNPQFDGQEVSVEAYILDFDADILGEELRLDFVARLRDEQRFAGLEELKAQMHRDVARAREVLAVAQEPGELLLRS